MRRKGHGYRNAPDGGAVGRLGYAEKGSAGRDDLLRRALALPVGVAVDVVLDAILGFLAGTGTRTGPNGSADDRARRSGDGTADDGPSDGAGGTTGSGSGLLLVMAAALGGLAGDCATGGADDATHDRAGRSTNGHADSRPAQGTGTRAGGLSRGSVAIRHVLVALEDLAVGHDSVLVPGLVTHLVLLFEAFRPTAPGGRPIC
jgi:hypothetical protein